MIRLILFLVVIAALAFAAAWVADDPGNVTLDWRGYVVETSVAVLIGAVLAVAVAVTLLVMLLRWLQRTGPWAAVIGINAVILTMFLWHMSAAVITAALLYPTGILPEVPVDTGEWLLWQIPWLAACAIVLAIFVAIFSRVEARSSGMNKGQTVDDAPLLTRLHLSGTAWNAVVVVAIAGVVAGLLTIAMVSPSPDYVASLPTAGLISYFAGAALLRLTRNRQTRERQHS
jgi:hypothetical protein